MTATEASGTPTKRRVRSILLWSIAFIVTLSAAVYQRLTGPTYPLRGRVDIAGRSVSFSLERNETVSVYAPVTITAPDTAISGSVRYRRYKSFDEWSEIEMQRDGDTLSAFLPQQPAAGKIMYYVYLEAGDERVSLSSDEPVVLRYKGPVPPIILVPHVVIMFLAMLLSNRTALEAMHRRGNARQFIPWTIALFFLGGIMLGPLVQNYAFGALWTGFPLGTDLTDNKTLIAFVSWLSAWYFNRQGRQGRVWIIFAATLTLAVYLIPHSVMGSEIDYTTIPQ